MQLALAMACVLMGSALVGQASLDTLATSLSCLAGTVAAPTEIVHSEAAIQNVIVMTVGLASAARLNWRSVRAIAVATVLAWTVFVPALHHLKERAVKSRARLLQILLQRSASQRSTPQEAL